MLRKAGVFFYKLNKAYGNAKNVFVLTFALHYAIIRLFRRVKVKFF